MINNSKGKRIVIFILALFIMYFPISVVAQNNPNTANKNETYGEEAGRNTVNTPSNNRQQSKDGKQTIDTPSNRFAISSGVYAISQTNTSSYVRCNTEYGGTYISQQQFSSVPASEADRLAMFKITYRSSTDDYVIRSMVNNEVIIYANVGFNAPLSIRLPYQKDNFIPSEKAWKITATSNGYYTISCTISGTTYYLYMPSSGNLALTTNGSINGTKWNFHLYSGETIRGWGKIGEWPEHIENGTSMTIEAYIYSTVIGENHAWINIYEVDSDVASVSCGSYHSQISITPQYGGNTKIQIEGNEDETIFGYYFLLSGWDTGSFFIQNEYSSDFLTVLDGTSDSFLRLNGLSSGSDKEYTLWNMVYWSQGYYKIVQDVVGDCIYGNNNTSIDLQGKPWADAVWTQILWKFYPQSDGTYKIQSYYHESNNPDNYVSLDDTSIKNVRCLANTGDKQLWNIQPIKLNLHILFDQAFIDKHNDVGCHTVLHHVFGDNSAGISLADSLFNNVGIRVNITYTSSTNSPFQSYPYVQNCLLCSSAHREELCLNHNSSSIGYNCDTPDQITEVLDCTNGKHHKTWTKFQEYMPISDNYYPILFTGHTACGENGTLHEQANVSGYANYVGGTKIVILGQGGVDSTGDESARLLLHEIIHILNVPEDADNYGDDSNPNHDPDKEYRMNCVMGFNRRESPYFENLTICSHCVGIIKMYKYTLYNH